MEKKGQMRNTGTIWFLLDVIFGAYLLNVGLKFINIPATIIPDSVSNIIILIGGALLVVAGIMSMTRRNVYPSHYR